jgi:hypothetical protein
MQYKQVILFPALVLIWAACTKTEPRPFEISIPAIKDSLTLRPITFSATVSETPDFYDWDFGDGSTATTASPQHTYQKMGDYSVVCTAKLRGISYKVGYKLKIKGDSRLVGQRRFYGTETYNSALGPLATPINFVDRPIKDTILDFHTANTFELYIFGVPVILNHDTLGEILYQYQSTTTHNKQHTFLRFYAANDSAYVFSSSTDNPNFGDSHQFNLYQKR